MLFRYVTDTNQSESASPEIIWGLGGPEEDHQLHHHCWTGRVSEREEEEEEFVTSMDTNALQLLEQRHVNALRVYNEVNHITMLCSYRNNVERK